MNHVKSTLCVLVCALTFNLRADILPVTNTDDSGPGSLRDALAGTANDDTIDVTGVAGIILLTSGELFVTNNVTLLGPGPAVLSIDGNAGNRVFHIGVGSTVTLAGLTITNGLLTELSSVFEGGGIFNEFATLTVSNCIVAGNAALAGGGIFNAGGSVELIDTTVSDNAAETSGGGAYNDGTVGSATLTMTASTLSGNSAESGGGIFNDGSNANAELTIRASTFSGNLTGELGAGGGIYNNGGDGSAAVTIANSTFTGNSAASGGGILNTATTGLATLEIANSILNAGVAGENIRSDFGIVISLGFNLSSDDGDGWLDATGDLTETDPLLGPLQDNGGPTFTHALMPGSPAINAGDCDEEITADQRGLPRSVGSVCDIGAFEAQPCDVEITCSNDFSVDATAPNGANVNYPPLLLDDECPGATTNSAPASGSIFPIGLTMVTYTLTDAVGIESTCTFTIHVRNAPEQLARLRNRVIGFELNPRDEAALLRRLESAQRGLDKDSQPRACRRLTAFIRNVNRRLAKGQVPQVEADQMTTAATQIRVVLDCP